MTPTLPVLDPLAAFVDVGSEEMYVSIAGGPPEVFGTVTMELHRLRDWLKEREVKSIAMEATGVYWLPLYGVLEAAGLEVLMVNGKYTRNLPGRKTDMKDCQWGATLHAHGLLRAGFVPPADIRRLQDYLRLRADHIVSASASVQHQQKALERMNVKLHDVISSLVGTSGRKVIEAILKGEREPERLLALCDVQIQQKKADRVKEALRGTWRRSISSPCGRRWKTGSTIRNKSRRATGRSKRCCARSAARINPVRRLPRQPSVRGSTRRRSRACTGCWSSSAAAKT